MPQKYLNKLFLLMIAVLLVACDQAAKTNTESTPQIDTSNLPVISFSYDTQGLNTANNVINVSEGVGLATIKATLSKPVDYEVAFLYAFISDNSTAENPSDFVLPSPTAENGELVNSAVLVFAPGEVEKTFTVSIVDDPYYEKDETITLNIFNNPNNEIQSVVNLPVDANRQTFFQINILNTDALPIIEISSIEVGGEEKIPLVVSSPTSEVAVSEGEESVQITLSLPQTKSRLEIRAKFELTPGPETIEDIDYGFPAPENRLSPTENIGEIIIPPEQEKVSFYIPFYSDLNIENSETLTFTLLDTEDAIITSATTNAIIFTINDDDKGDVALNDTGIGTCYDDAVTPVDCNHIDFPNQDGAINVEPRFLKYNFVRPVTEFTSKVSVPLLDSETQWDCVYDTNTGLLWEIGTIRRISQAISPDDTSQKYTWFNDNPATNGGADGNKCDSNDPTNTEGCSKKSTEDHIKELNAPGFSGQDYLCEVNNWRLPKLNELLSIMDFENNGNYFLNPDYFPNTSSTFYYWTATPSAVEPDQAWCVYFGKVIKDAANLCDKTTELPAIMVSTVNIITP